MRRKWHDFYPEGIPYDVEIPTDVSIYDTFEEAVGKSPSSLAVIDEELVMTYSELKVATERLAKYLYKQGMKKGDHVAVMLPNCAEYVVCYFALQRLGCTQVQVNTLYQSSELTHILNDSKAKWIVCDDAQVPKLKAIELSSEIEKVVFDAERDLFQRICFHDEETANIQLPNVPINPMEDVAFIQYTGGTTGNAKGVMLTHYNIVGYIIQNRVFYFLRENEEITLGNTPMAHVMGIGYLNLTIAVGGTYIIVRRFNILKVKELLLKYAPTIFIGAPTIYIALLNSDEIDDDDLKSLKICTCGTAPLPLEVIKEFEERSGAQIMEGYGMSEVLVTHRNPLSQKKTGSIGIPIPGVDCKIVKLEDRNVEVPAGEEGELLIKGPQVMKGYWNNPDETAQALIDGWMATGDIAVMDEDGYFFIVGRKKDLIIASGYNIYPIEVENVVYEHPAVFEACVFGVPDSYRGETVKCVIVLKEGQKMTEEEIISFCKERLATYKVPKIFEFRKSLPKTAVGKIMKRQLMKEELMK
ncbi:long-chain-fatty-acid--CoA ligase [Saccharococcus sp. Marseille-Q5394]|uniref:long-chain-fatty-acid--CoA ligase n=1 Tax=Saccharococcus sp. Marseille-Q5394 TaxID=2972778 RepID=UPI0021C7F373|nr:long-chain fatty acid--CoA ligase [Saccharococcus sp. Marseille-Q5394]